MRCESTPSQRCVPISPAQPCLSLEVIRPAQTDIRFQRYAHYPFERLRNARQRQYFRGLACLSAGDEEVRRNRHPILKERPQHGSPELCHRHADKAIAQRLGLYELKLAANLQMEWQVILGCHRIPDCSRRLRYRLARLSVPRVGLRVGEVNTPMLEVPLYRNGEDLVDGWTNDLLQAANGITFLTIVLLLMPKALAVTR